MILKSILFAAAFAVAAFPVAASFAEASQADDRIVKRVTSMNGRAVVERAKAFLASLSRAQRAEAILPYSFSAASHWSNLPEQDMWRGRSGLSTKTLSPTQWQALNALLEVATGSGRNEGFEEIRQILNADDFISQNGKRRGGYGRGEYRVAILGEPDISGKWQLQFGGHHLALNNTYVDGDLLGATPSFRGAEPQRFTLDGTENQPMVQKHAAFVELIASLDSRQLGLARFRRSPDHLIAGPGEDWKFPVKPFGIVATDMNTEQRKLLRSAIALYVRDADETSAARITEIYDRELDQTHFSFGGAPSLSTTNDYARIDGPSVWIELIMDGPWSFAEPHPHSVWRDKRTDYGGTRD